MFDRCRRIEAKVGEIDAKLDAALVLLADIFRQGESVMASLDDVLADVTAESTAIDSVSVFIQGLRDQINGLGLSPANQAKVDAIFTAAESNKAKIATALAANVPPSP